MNRRIHFLDELRGFCVILMVFFHAFYTAGYVFGWEIGTTLFDFFLPAEPFFAGVFVFICGLCCNFSHNNLKRGLCLAGVALGLSAVLWFAIQREWLTLDSQIWFGILHLLAVCILLYTLLYPTVRFIPVWIGLPLCALLFAATYSVSPTQGGFFGIAGLFRWDLPSFSPENPLYYVLGLCPVDYAGDYFPLLPWVFCFFGGCYLGRWHRHFPRFMYRRHVPFLGSIGKVSLWIYLAHQPLLFGICAGVSWLISLTT